MVYKGNRMFRSSLTGRSAGLALLMLCLSAPVFAQNVYRWVDDDGKVHYTPSLPADRADKPHDILSRDGVVLERVTQPETTEPPPPPPDQAEPVPLYTEEERKEISERLLLLRYRDEAQIEEAMTFELGQLKYDFHLLDNEYTSMTKSLQQQIHAAANRQRAGLGVDDTQLVQIDELRSRMTDNRERLAELEQRQTAIREQFMRELKRFREIQERRLPHPTS